MDFARDINELVARYITSRKDETAAQDVVDLVTSIREQIERAGRIYEIKAMMKYHQRAADLTDDPNERNVHIADIVVLEARLSFLEKQGGTSLNGD